MSLLRAKMNFSIGTNRNSIGLCVGTVSDPSPQEEEREGLLGAKVQSGLCSDFYASQS